VYAGPARPVKHAAAVPAGAAAPGALSTYGEGGESGMPVEVRNDIALAIPFFLVLIGVEVLAARQLRRPVYRLQDALADLGCGIGQQVALVFFALGILQLYAALHAHSLVRFADGSGWPWLVAFFYVEVAYYWWHRASHEVNLLWAAHAVHHQSEDYNLAVALRQAVLTTATSLPFYLPMAFIGVPPTVYAATLSYSLLYQFWIHTELIGKLGPLERVLNTPSHHRVHHAVNPRYLDRNYGAILIVWDRLFGTFAEERERPVYGLTTPLRSYNPVLAQIEEWRVVARKARALPRRRDRLLLWLRSPAWTPAGPATSCEEEVQRRPKHEIPISRRARGYALLQFAPVVAVTFLLLLGQASAPRAWLALGAAFVCWTLLSIGGLLDGRRWAVPLEAARVAAVVLAVGGLALRAPHAAPGDQVRTATGGAPRASASSAAVAVAFDGRSPAAGAPCSSP
jgi:sterol desaturase/sphingolipid hydroxylase (fatty acid hydroxylase superfamily)